MVSRLLSKAIIVFIVTIVSTLVLSMGKVDAMAMQDRATWLWDTTKIVEDESGVLSFLESKKVNKLYLQINSDIASNYYKSFIDKATAKGIKVYALDGSESWVSIEGYKMQDQLDWLHTYNENAAATEQFSGVHLDVEPYLNSGWGSNQAKTIESYQALLTRAKGATDRLHLPLEVDMPFWFDEITYKNQFGKGLLADWVIDQVESVSIMAYRDAAKDIINIVEHEINYAKKVKKSIVIGVETGASYEGENITFYDDGEAYMNKQLAQVHQQYANKKSYNGFAIHHVDGWMNMQP
ncbi:amidase [Lysinibacillus xylanilyticus]|uniref:Amidase n=1 Tax=Lysinibacillus xylanilyticus TaxID=582475 RepID=A0A2M9QBY1_9BACI|nr:amidase [Lysinibacillus xylanilyticus]PJO45582.1 amidase [Lysinibacillus xylanilyticus]